MRAFSSGLTQHADNHINQFAGAGDGRNVTRAHQSFGNGTGAAFLAVNMQNIGQQIRRGLIDQLGRTHAVIAHPHVKRPVTHEGKPALSLIKLHGGHAKVENHAIDLRHISRRQQRAHIAETASYKAESVAKLSSEGIGCGLCRRVAVKSDNPALRRFKQSATITARAKCAIDIDSIVARRHGVKNFGQ